MLDDATPTEASVEVPRCMWCSSALPSDSETTCPTCGATLVGEGDNQVPGVTAIDAEAIIRVSREQKPQRRSRLMSWISGEYPEEEKPAPPGSLEPPPLEVRREMLRLELEAQVANLQAEAGALAAEQAVEAVEAGAPPEAAVADAAATVAAVDEATADAAELAAPTPEAIATGEATNEGLDRDDVPEGTASVADALNDASAPAAPGPDEDPAPA
jgi:hypothetical protein